MTTMLFRPLRTLSSVRLVVSAFALGLAGMLALTGCSPQGAEAPEEQVESPSSTPAPEPAPEPQPEPVELVLPTECNAMNATAEGESLFFHTEVALGGSSPNPGKISLESFGESNAGSRAKHAMTQAVRGSGCGWYVNFHNGVNQWIAELPAEASGELLAELRASDYEESELSGYPAFTYTTSEQTPIGVNITNFEYVFVEGVWIAVIGNGELDYLPAAVDALLWANPSLSAQAS